MSTCACSERAVIEYYWLINLQCGHIWSGTQLLPSENLGLDVNRQHLALEARSPQEEGDNVDPMT